MKILQVCSYLYPALQYGGPAKVVYDLSKELSKKHEITVLTSDVWDHERRILSQEQIQSSKSFTIIYAKNIINSIAYTHRIFTCFSMIPYIIRNRKKFDVVHVHDVFILPQLFLGLLAQHFGIRVILSPHGVLDPVRLEKKTLGKSLLFGTLVRPLASKAEKIIATADKEATDLKKLGFEQITVVPNGIPKPTVKASNIFSNLRSNKLTLLYIGKLHPQKGLLELLEAIIPYVDDLDLILAGPDDGLQTVIQQFIKKNKLDNVHLVGFVGDAEKAELFSIADLFVYPSYAEGFSISILEALQAALPVLITTGCNFKMVETKRAGYIVSSDNLSAGLSRAIHKIVTEREVLRPMRENAKSLVESMYTIEKMVQKLNLIYEK